MRAVVDLPTATDPAMPMTKGVLETPAVLRKRLRCWNSNCEDSTWAESRRDRDR
ncbi:hypothetical protein D3C72_2016370 [compost metagenome]